MGIIASLTREQKEAVGLLQIGTFLEYFDLMLYVHMAVLLNELFFPKTDPHTAALLSAFAFCSTFVLRPFGALIFGYIGDTIGRKSTVIITTMLMSTSCIMMANLPTYAQIGITATWIVTICRIVQGLSSMGEIIGALIYVSEITKPPVQYPVVSFISVASSIGAFSALGVATIVTSTGLNWRIGFWIGAGIAVIGSLARTRLRETPEFIENKSQIKRYNNKSANIKLSKHLSNFHTGSDKDKIGRKTFISFFFVYCGWPLSFYLAFMYFNPLLTNSFGYTSENIIHHNFLLSIILCISNIWWSVQSYKTYPLKLLKRRGTILLMLLPFIPFIISYANHPYQIFTVQSLLLILSLGGLPADSIFIKYFPVLKRFTATSFLYALTRSVMYIITSFGLVYLTNFFGYYGLWIITIPITLAFLWGIRHFEKLEQANGVLPKQKNVQKKEGEGDMILAA